MTTRPDFSKMTAADLEAWSNARHAEIAAAHAELKRDGYVLVRADGSKTSGPAVWVKAERLS